MANRACVLCGGPITPCYVVDSGGSYPGECHGMSKTALGVSRNRSKLTAYVCAECGYLMYFAANPGVFRAEAQGVAGTFPLPARSSGSAESLPIPSDPAEDEDA